ncbi:rhomboid family intramembrane serine protease [Chloroflexota bacterium]
MIYRSRQRPLLNPILAIIGINLLLFIATLIMGQVIVNYDQVSFSIYKLHYYMGLIPIAFWERPWTILTSMFLHGGFGHIFANMFTLFFFGSSLLNLVGKNKFLTVYFGGGILGNILLLILSPIFPFSIAIGASGAVFSIAGVLTVMAPKAKVFVFPIPLPIPLWIAVIGGFLILSFLPFVAWQAHLGGLAFGLIAGFLFRRKERYYSY